MKTNTKNITTPNTDWEGTWDTPFGELRLHQPQSSIVYGDYGDVGVIEASYSNSGVLTGTFTNGNRMGLVQFQLTDKTHRLSRCVTAIPYAQKTKTKNNKKQTP